MTGRLDSEVIIIGGGATGAGIARDCARRGLRTLLIERPLRGDRQRIRPRMHQ